MTLRTTRQNIEVLGTGDSILRATRQNIEVLGSGASSLRVTRQMYEVLWYDNQYRRQTADTLSYTEVIAFSVDRNPHVYDTLVFAEFLPQSFAVEVNDTLTLEDSAARAKTAAASDTLDFTDQTEFFHIIQDFWPAGDIVTFIETVDVENGNWRFVPDTLVFSETIDWQGPHYVEINHYISFQEQINNNNFFTETVADILTLVQYAGRPYTLIVSDSLVFSDLGKRIIDATDSLVFNEIVLIGKWAPALDTLHFNQTITLQGSFTRAIIEPLNLGQSVAYYYINPCIDKQYHPFVGASDVLLQPAAPTLNLPITQWDPAVTRFELQYPAMGGVADSITLRAPELDSHDRSAFNRVNRETRGGRLVVFADPIWPKVTTIACTFIGLTKVEMLGVQNFIHSHIGEEIRVIDWEGRGWRGVVIKPNSPATCDGRRGWSIGFEFEGSRILDNDSGLALVFSDSATTIVHRYPTIAEALIFNQEALYQVN
jgi:hypothetical protein